MGYGDTLETGAEWFESSSGGGIDAMNLDARTGGVAVFLAEGVFEDSFDVVCGLVVGVNRQVLVSAKAEGTQIVEAHDVIGVAVGVEDGVDMANAFAQGLGVEVGAGIDEYDVTVVGEAD